MGTIYRIAEKVWGISDLPWPFFYGIKVWITIKIIIGTLALCLFTLTYPLLYLFGIGYLIKTKQQPNWLYFTLYTILLIWYLFCIVKFLILGVPAQSYSSWPSGDKPIAGTVIPKQKISENLIWKDGELVPFDESLEVSDQNIGAETIHYRLTVRDPEFEYEWLNTHRKEQNLETIYLTPRQINSLAGIYAWDSNIKFSTQAQLLNYLCKNVEEMQKYKISTTDPFGGKIKTSGERNPEDEYSDRLDEYRDDPEDELEFDPEIFDFQND